MAVLKVPPSWETHVGLSTDAKPTGVPVGSRFFERDTGLEFVTDDGSTWGALLYSAGNVEGIALASANSDVDRISADVLNADRSGGYFILKITAVPSPIGTSTVALVLSGRNPVDGSYFTIAATGAKNSVGGHVMMVAPGAAGGGQITDKDQIILPRRIRVSTSHAGATGTGGFTYSVSYVFV